MNKMKVRNAGFIIISILALCSVSIAMPIVQDSKNTEIVDKVEIYNKIRNFENINDIITSLIGKYIPIDDSDDYWSQFEWLLKRWQAFGANNFNDWYNQVNWLIIGTIPTGGPGIMILEWFMISSMILYLATEDAAVPFITTSSALLMAIIVAFTVFNTYKHWVDFRGSMETNIVVQIVDSTGEGIDGMKNCYARSLEPEEQLWALEKYGLSMDDFKYGLEKSSTRDELGWYNIEIENIEGTYLQPPPPPGKWEIVIPSQEMDSTTKYVGTTEVIDNINPQETYIRTIEIDTNPNIPSEIIGPVIIRKGDEVSFRVSTSDPDKDRVKYYFDWGDGFFDWTDFNDSSDEVDMFHTWDNAGSYDIKVKAEDDRKFISNWSPSLKVHVYD